MNISRRDRALHCARTINAGMTSRRRWRRQVWTQPPHCDPWDASTPSLRQRRGSRGPRGPVQLLGWLGSRAEWLACSTQGCGGKCGPGGKLWQPNAGFMTHVTCRLTAKNRDQLRNPALGNRVWATFAFYLVTNFCNRLAFFAGHAGSLQRFHRPPG